MSKHVFISDELGADPAITRLAAVLDESRPFAVGSIVEVYGRLAAGDQPDIPLGLARAMVDCGVLRRSDGKLVVGEITSIRIEDVDWVPEDGSEVLGPIPLGLRR